MSSEVGTYTMQYQFLYGESPDYAFITDIYGSQNGAESSTQEMYEGSVALTDCTIVNVHLMTECEKYAWAKWALAVKRIDNVWVKTVYDGALQIGAGTVVLNAIRGRKLNLAKFFRDLARRGINRKDFPRAVLLELGLQNLALAVYAENATATARADLAQADLELKNDLNGHGTNCH